MANVISSLDLILDMALIVIGLGVVGAIIFFVVRMAQFKHKIRLRVMTSDRCIIEDDKARELKDKSGVLWWKLRKTRLKVPMPPAEVIDVDRKGKMVAEAYLFEGDNIVWVDDTLERVIDSTKIKRKNKCFMIEGFEPFTTQQRALLVNEFTQADAYKKKGLSDLLAQAVPYIALVMIISVFLLFFGEAVQPVMEVGEQQAALQEKNVELIEAVKDIVQDRTRTNTGGVPD